MFFIAYTGAVVNHSGECAKLPCPMKRARGLILSFFAFDSRIIIRAAAPSEIEEEFAAVTVPFSSKTGFNLEIFSKSAFRGC